MIICDLVVFCIYVLFTVSADFSFMPVAATTITFAASSAIPSLQCLSVLAADDTIVEADEDFDLVLTMTDQMPDVVVGGSDTTAVTIPDNDGIAIILVLYESDVQ